MNEEIKKAVELTDEEMDNISGGKAMIVYKGRGAVYICSHKKISGSEFSANLGHNNCDRYKGSSNIKKCQACQYYDDSMCESQLNETTMKGYDVVTY